MKDNADALYFAFVNKTTLAYGDDIVPHEPLRILGPVAANERNPFIRLVDCSHLRDFRYYNGLINRAALERRKHTPFTVQRRLEAWWPQVGSSATTCNREMEGPGRMGQSAELPSASWWK